jgi:lysophospholipase L1-like esterase
MKISHRILSLLGLAVLALARGWTAEQASAPAKVPGAVLDPRLPTLWIAGDSTAAPGAAASVGWGVPLSAYFDLTRINVANCARGGRSSRTFITDGSWEKLIAGVKPGDFVLIQFGHNDGGAINEEPPGSKRPLRARGSLAGLGEESKTIDNIVTRQREVVYTFGHYIRKMIADTRARGAAPIVLSLTIRNSWSDGKVERGSGKYGAWSEAIAKSADVPFINLSSLIANAYEQRGQEAVQAFFPNATDQTHTGAAGADFNAARVVAGLRRLQGAPLDPFLSEKGRAIAPAK